MWSSSSTLPEPLIPYYYQFRTLNILIWSPFIKRPFRFRRAKTLRRTRGCLSQTVLSLHSIFNGNDGDGDGDGDGKEIRINKKLTTIKISINKIVRDYTIVYIFFGMLN